MTGCQMSKFQSLLLKAVKFVSLSGAKQCCFKNGFVSSYFDGVYLEHPIEENLDVSVNINYFCKAIEAMGSSVAFTEIINNLHIHNDQLKVTCAGDDCNYEFDHSKELTICTPEPIIEAIKILADLPSKKKNRNQQVNYISMFRYSMLATDSFCVVETWHGLDLPQGMISPQVAKILRKMKQPCESINVSNESLTFRFAQGLMQSQILPLPNKKIHISDYFEETYECCPLLDTHKDAIRQILPFAGDCISITTEEISSCNENGKVSFPCEFPFAGDFINRGFYLLLSANEFSIQNCNLVFFGDTLRGCISEYNLGEVE
jgi:hypothetical protein